MAAIELLADKLFKWEGGFVNDPDDPGGATNMGVTISTWKKVGYDKDADGDIDSDDIRLLTKDDAMIVLRKFYWDKWRADEILSQPVANMLVDWYWSSGKWGIIIPQRLLNVKPDGVVGPVTIGKVNSLPGDIFLIQLYDARVKFIKDIVKNNPSQKKFEKGWINRVNDFAN